MLSLTPVTVRFLRSPQHGGAIVRRCQEHGLAGVVRHAAHGAHVVLEQSYHLGLDDVPNVHVSILRPLITCHYHAPCAACRGKGGRENRIFSRGRFVVLSSWKKGKEKGKEKEKEKEKEKCRQLFSWFRQLWRLHSHTRGRGHKRSDSSTN